jgi:glycosyltransferase involved in cell wall biosynthesis
MVICCIQEFMATSNSYELGPPGKNLAKGALLNPPLPGTDVLCISHLRWNFVFQRPQHLMTRRASHGRVFFFEEPVVSPDPQSFLDLTETPEGVTVATPHLPEGLGREEIEAIQAEFLEGLVADKKIRNYVLWVYTPMAMAFARHLKPAAVVYDCMDELTGFRGASPRLRDLEADLFGWADAVFTGGLSLYEAKRAKHHNVFPFPSSIDVAHFARARATGPEPADQLGIPHPRLGFCGVLDERLDIELLHDLAASRPDWQFVMVGPAVKIDPASLPQLPNIHYLGGKKYSELPAYFRGWDVALLLFAHNDSTRYISPTKTPEYLAAGRPVVSTSIRDVVRPYGERGLVRIADQPEEFIGAVEQALAQGNDPEWLAKVDEFLSHNSWDSTCERMFSAVADAMEEKQGTSEPETTRSLAG